MTSSHFVEMDDQVRLYCHIVGEGDPCIMVHGGPGLSMDYLLPSMEVLAKSHLVIFYDQRGNGKSPSKICSDTMQPDRFIKDIKTIQNHFNFKKINIIGHSTGAYFAMLYAISYPDQINKLIVLNSTSIADHAIPKSEVFIPQDNYEKMIDDILKLDTQNAAELIKPYKDLFQHFFYDSTLFNQLNLDSMTAEQIQNSAKIHRIFGEVFFHQGHSLREGLAQLHIPTLIMHGNNHDTPLTIAQEIHALIHGSVLKVLNAGHFPYIEKPDDFFNCLATFLNNKN